MSGGATGRETGANSSMVMGASAMSGALSELRWSRVLRLRVLMVESLGKWSRIFEVYFYLIGGRGGIE